MTLTAALSQSRSNPLSSWNTTKAEDFVRPMKRNGSSSIAAVSYEQRIEYIVPPLIPHAEIIAQQTFSTEPEFLDQCT